MPARFYPFLFLIFSSFLMLRANDFLQLHSTDGRKLEARLILLQDEEVEIELRDGRRFTLPLERFSLSSRKALMESAGGAAEAAPQTPPANPVSVGMPGQELEEDPAAVAKPRTELPTPFVFEGFRFRERKGQSVDIYGLGVNSGGLEKVGDQVVALMKPRLAGLPGLLDKGYRFQIYLADEHPDYMQLLKIYVSSLEDRSAQEFLLGTAPQLGQFTDFEHRFAVSRVEESVDLKGLSAHQVGFSLVALEAEVEALPLWLRMGSGYWAEEKIQKRCTVFYANFEAYEENRYSEEATGEGILTLKDILDSKKSWVPAIQRMNKSGLKVGLARMLELDVASLTPQESAQTMGLFAFCTSSPEHIAGFQKLLSLIRQGFGTRPDEFAALFGYADAAAFEAEWLRYLKAGKF